MPIRAQISSTSASSSNANATILDSCFGRGVTPPRRQTGLYELERDGIEVEKLISDESPEENAFASAIGLFVIGLTLIPTLTPAPVEGPLALLAGTLMTAWAVDSLALDGIGSSALSMQLQNKRRVACHEAGHLLVGYLLGLEVKSFILPSARNSLKGIRGGVELSGGDGWTRAATGLAGIAAEVVCYGGSLGGGQDMKEVGTGVASMGLGVEGRKGVVRWGMLCAVRLLREHHGAHKLVTEAMLNGASAEECVKVVEENVIREQLVEKTA